MKKYENDQPKDWSSMKGKLDEGTELPVWRPSRGLRRIGRYIDNESRGGKRALNMTSHFQSFFFHPLCKTIPINQLIKIFWT